MELKLIWHLRGVSVSIRGWGGRIFQKIVISHIKKWSPLGSVSATKTIIFLNVKEQKEISNNLHCLLWKLMEQSEQFICTSMLSKYIFTYKHEETEHFRCNSIVVSRGIILRHNSHVCGERYIHLNTCGFMRRDKEC